MKRGLIVIHLMVLLVTACSAKNAPGEMSRDAEPDDLPNLIGTFVINGIDPLGEEYGGHLTISAGDEPGTYHLQWIVVGGIQEGIGMVKGNKLVIEWQTIDGVESASGTALFTITESGQLYGIRTSDSLDGEGEEQAYPNQ